MKRITAFFVLMSCLVTSRAVAHNNYFLPGDAFFAVTITRSDIEAWEDASDAKFEFEYSRFDGKFYSCGNIGYTKLVVDGITPAFRSALSEAYWRFTSGTAPLYREMERDGKTSLEQANGVVALVYQKTFSGMSLLGLKLNEDWTTQGGGMYGGFLNTARAVMLDWSESPSVSPLAVREKLEPLAHLAKSYGEAATIGEPLHISSDDIQIILVGFAEQKSYGAVQTCPELQSILENEEGARHIVVTSGLLREATCDENGRWEEESTKTPVKEGSSVPEKRQPKPTSPSK